MPFVNPEDILPIADEYGLDRNLLNKVIETESSWNPDAVSPVGAQGLMQLMPKTAEWLGVKDPFNPEENVRAGAKYLSSLIQRYNGDLVKALAAYNWGPGNVDKWSGNFEDLPHETRNYITKILGDQIAQQRNEDLQRRFLQQTGLSPEEAAAEFGGIQPAVNPAEIIASAAAGGIPSAIRSGGSLLGTIGEGLASGIAATPSAVVTEPLVDKAYDYSTLAGIVTDLGTAVLSGVTIDRAFENVLKKWGTGATKYLDDALQIIQEKEVAQVLKQWVKASPNKLKEARQILPEVVDYFRNKKWRYPVVSTLDVIESVPAKTAKQAQVIWKNLQHKLQNGGKLNELELRPLAQAIKRKEEIVKQWLRENPRATSHIGRLFTGLGWGAVAGLGVDEDTGQWTYDPEKGVIGFLAGATLGPGPYIRNIGVIAPTEAGRFLRSKRPAESLIKVVEETPDIAYVQPDEEVINLWCKFLNKIDWQHVNRDYDLVMTPEEAIDRASQMVYLKPVVTKNQGKLRWRPDKDTGWIGNKKMQFPNKDIYLIGRNTYDNAGCGRNFWLESNGITSEHPTYGACYRGDCYAAAIGKIYDRQIAEAFRKVIVKGKLKQEVQEFVNKYGIEKAKAAFPDLEISISSKGNLVVKRIEEAKGAIIHTKYQNAKYTDIRLGVDTDGGAFLSDPRSMDGLLSANTRTLSVYSSAYHLPPPPHELADRSIINVTVSGWHSLPETLHRLRYAYEARRNGWNVILREVVASPNQFDNSTVNLYNRWHKALLDTDFFLMEQPYHYATNNPHGRGTITIYSDPIGDIPACCMAGRTVHTCHDCPVAEGLGRGFQRYWGITEEPEKGEIVLPAIKDYTGNREYTKAR